MRLDRGGDRAEFGRLPYFPEDAVAALSTAAPLVLVGTKSPVAFFGYREHPSALAEGVATLTLSTDEEDSYAALVALDEELSGLPVGASTATVRVGGQTAALSDEQGLDGWTIGSVAAETMPEDAIVSIEGGTVGHSFFAASQNGPRHSSSYQHRWCNRTGTTCSFWCVVGGVTTSRRRDSVRWQCPVHGSDTVVDGPRRY